jgi:SRSO17 transposase
LSIPKFTRIKAPQHGPEWRHEPNLSLYKRPPSMEALRHDFANLVVRQLVSPATRVAVIDEHGKPAMVKCSEALFGVLSKDHPIVGVYKPGASVRDVIDDLKAAGL